MFSFSSSSLRPLIFRLAFSQSFCACYKPRNDCPCLNAIGTAGETPSQPLQALQLPSLLGCKPAHPIQDQCDMPKPTAHNAPRPKFSCGRIEQVVLTASLLARVPVTSSLKRMSDISDHSLPRLRSQTVIA